MSLAILFHFTYEVK